MDGIHSIANPTPVEPTVVKELEEERALSNALKGMMVELEQKWPGLATDWEAQMNFLDQDRAELLFRGVRFEISGLDGLQKKIHELHEREQLVQEKKEIALERSAKVDGFKTFVTVGSSLVRIAPGSAFLVSGAVPLGIALLASAGISAGHEVAQKCGWYSKVAASMGGSEKEIQDRAYHLDKVIGTFDFFLLIGTMLAGGTEGLSHGVKALTSSSQVTSRFTSATHAILTVVQGKSMRDIGELGALYMEVRRQISVTAHERDDGQGKVDRTMEAAAKLFDSSVYNLQIKQRTQHVIARNMAANQN